MKTRLLHILLLIAWLTSLLSAGGCRRAAPVQPELTQSAPFQSTSAAAPAIQTSEAGSQVQSATSDSLPGSELSQFPNLAGLAGLPFDQFLEDSFRIILLRDPEWITSEGLSAVLGTDNSRLTPISDAYQQESLEIYRGIAELLASYDRASLTTEQQVSFAAYQWYLEDLHLQGEFRFHDYPVNPIITGFQSQIQYLFTDLHQLATLEDAKDYVSRLSQVEMKIEQLIANLRLRQEQEIFPPHVAIQASLGSIREIASSSAEETPFYRTLQEKLGGVAGLSEAERQSLFEEARKAIDGSLIPAYQALAVYLADMQTIDTRTGGAWQHPDGEAYYQAVLRHHTTTNLTPDEIYQIGLDALDDIRAELRQHFDRLGYPQEESLAQLYRRVAQDGGFVQGNQILPGYQALIDEASQNLDLAFDMQPSASLKVSAGPGTTAFYVSPAVDGSRPGVFYAPVYGSEPRFKMPTLAYHEGVPGHHYQISLAQELDLPLFRSLVAFTGYTEGWALYAERLAEELGWYADDPYGDLGRLQMEAFRAARLVVDTGLHARRWTFDQAVEFLLENTGLEQVFIQNEVVRYLVWPGQAASYAVGYFKLLELRQKAMDTLGDSFDLVDFHRAVLSNGSLPLEVLERVVDDYMTLASLEQVSDYPLYVMHYQGDYGFSGFLQAGLPPEALEISSPIADASDPGVPSTWACTGFATLSPVGDRLLGRNFDWQQHPALLLYTDPPEGYASVAMVDLYYLGYDHQVDHGDRDDLLRAPYLPFDGLNERGLAIGMMAVSESDSGFDPARRTISGLNLIRLVLDAAASVEEAVVLMGKYNLDFNGGPPLHYFLADASGDSAVVEFIQGKIQVFPDQHPWQVATNFLISAERPEGADSSCWRYNLAYSTLQQAGGTLSLQRALDLLESVSQPGDYATRWSIVYNLTTKEIALVMGRAYSSQVFSFRLDE